MNATHVSRDPRRAARGIAPALLLAVLAGCATTGGGGGGLVPVRADRPAAGGTPETTATRAPVNPVANDPATAGADDVPVPSPTPVPAPGEVVGATASGGQITRRVPAVVDSGPSADAREVLATIPEPIPAGGRVPPPQRVQQLYPPRDATPGAGMAADSAAAAGDSAAAPANGIPIPEPTLPLGQRRPAPIPTIPDSVLRALADSAGRAPGSAAAAPGTAAPDSAAAPAAAAAAPDSCWRVQVAAPEEAERAEQLRAAAESLLLVPMVVEAEQGLFKVRTRDCQSGAGAGRLRGRAETSGFTGAFRFLRKP